MNNFRLFILPPRLILFITICLQFSNEIGARNAYAPCFGVGRTYEPKIHTLLIGIDDYGDEYRELSLIGCVNDAYDISSKLVAEGNEVRYQHVRTDSKANRTSIKAAIDSISREATPDDIFVFLFSGYSTDNDRAAVADSVILYLPGGDIRSERNLDSTLLPIPILAQWLSQIPCKRQFIILEAGDGVGFTNALLASMFEFDPNVSQAVEKNRTIITPSGYGLVYTDKVTGRPHGLLISFLLQIPNLSRSLNWHGTNTIEFDLFKAEASFRQDSSQAHYWTNKLPYFKVYHEPVFRSLFCMLSGSSRGVAADEEEEISPTGSHRKIALIVGTSKYENTSWARLRNPLNDARAIASVLHDKFGYELDTLYNQKRDSILAEFYRMKLTLDSTDEVVVVFSGHGYYNEQTSCGHIVPTDGLSPDVDQFSNSSYIQWNTLKNMIDAWHAKNVFVIVDVCFGGKFDQVAQEVVIHDYKTMLSDLNAKQYHDRKTERVSRMFLAAGSVPVPDYWKESQFHSPFANKLLTSLNGCTDFLTPSKIFKDMEFNVTEPVLRTFGRHDKVYGDFVLVPVTASVQQKNIAPPKSDNDGKKDGVKFR